MKLSKRPFSLGALIVLTALTILFSSALSSANPVERSLAQQGTSTATATPFPMLNAFLDEAPFPRVYVFDHASGPCMTNVELYKKRVWYANVVELHFRQGLSKNSTTPTLAGDEYMDYNSTLLDLDGDGVCYTTPDPSGQPTPDPGDVRVVDWLEDQWAQMPANAHGVSVPHYQIAFLPVWYFSATDVSGPNRVHRRQIDECDPIYNFRTDLTITPTPIPTDEAEAYLKTPYPWALHSAKTGGHRGKEVLWSGDATLALANVYIGTPIATLTPPVDIRCPSYTTKFTAETPTPQSFVEWAPKWLEARVGQTQLHDDPTSYNPWDGVRIDSQSNVHGWLKEAVDYDLDGIGDQKTDEQGNYVIDENPDGYHYTNRLYREGVHRILTELYQNHVSQWLVGGNDAWHPNGSSPDEPSGFGLMPNMHFTVAENWTGKWGTKNPEGTPEFSFASWPNPEVVAHTEGWQISPDFSGWVRIWDTWTHHGDGRKGFVILSKCDDPLGNKCNGLEAGRLDDNEYGWDDMHREFRFSLAAALMLDAYHAFTGEGYHMAPYWYDEYAVILKNGMPIAAKAGADENNNGVDDRAEGIGWLGYPVSDPLGVKSDGHITQTTLAQALKNSRENNPDGIDDFNVWVRYFEHGVAILNTSGKQKVILDDTFYRIKCSQPWYVNGRVDCNINSGQAVDPNNFFIPDHDGLLLYGDTGSSMDVAISRSEDDVYYYETKAYRLDDRGNLVEQWQSTEDETGPTITIMEPFRESSQERHTGLLRFRLSESQKQQVVNSDVREAYLRLHIPNYTPTPTPTPGPSTSHISIDGHDVPAITMNTGPIPLSTPFIMIASTNWTQRGHIGYNWRRSSSVKSLVDAYKTQDSWDGGIAIHLNPEEVNKSLLFETYDAPAQTEHEWAPALHIVLEKGAISPTPTPSSQATQEITFQHGVNGYYGGEDTFIVTTDWEPPTIHDTHPALYIRVNYPNEQIYSSLIRFNNATLPAGAEIVKAQLDMFYAGQSVNGGDLTAYVAYTKEPWKASETTWVNFQTSLYWNATGVKGVDDRDPHVYVLPVNYQQVGNWLSFDVTQVVKDTSGDDYDFFFYGSFDGVNKNIYFHSNDYWKASERPKLTIWYRMP